MKFDVKIGNMVFASSYGFVLGSLMELNTMQPWKENLLKFAKDLRQYACSFS